MKTKEQIKEKEFDTVKTFREIKEKISMELIGKSAQQIKDYLRTNSLKLYRYPHASPSDFDGSTQTIFRQNY